MRKALLFFALLVPGLVQAQGAGRLALDPAGYVYGHAFEPASSALYADLKSAATAIDRTAFERHFELVKKSESVPIELLILTFKEAESAEIAKQFADECFARISKKSDPAFEIGWVYMVNDLRLRKVAFSSEQTRAESRIFLSLLTSMPKRPAELVVSSVLLSNSHPLRARMFAETACELSKVPGTYAHAAALNLEAIQHVSKGSLERADLQDSTPDFAKCLELSQKCLTISPNYTPSLFMAGFASLQLQRKDEAVEYLKRYLQYETKTISDSYKWAKEIVDGGLQSSLGAA